MTRRITWPFRRSRRNITQETIVEDEPSTADHGMSPDTLEEIGQLLQEQGRYLDELTTRSNNLASENILLRERISSGIDNVSSKSSRRREPLSSIINTKKRMGDEFQKIKDENDMLLQQADMLAKELNDAHSSIAERDSSIASLSNELSGLLEKARTLSEYIRYRFILYIIVYMQRLIHLTNNNFIQWSRRRPGKQTCSTR